MPGKLKSSKQFRFLEGIAHGMKSDKDSLSKKTARKMLSHESHELKSRFAKRK